jgi:hypothetical protein
MGGLLSKRLFHSGGTCTPNGAGQQGTRSKADSGDDHADTVTAVGTIHQIKVTLCEVHPPVWRRVHLPSTATLDQLHEVIQVAMGWQQHHLHLFGKGDAEYGALGPSGWN